MGTPEIIIIVVIVLLVFGSSWLPALARKAGRTSVDVEKARKEFESTRDQFKETTAPVTDTVSKVNKTIKSSPTDLAKQALAAGGASAAEQVPVGAMGPEVDADAALAAEAEIINQQEDDADSDDDATDEGGADDKN